jgi:hypothetical protein
MIVLGGGTTARMPDANPEFVSRLSAQSVESHPSKIEAAPNAAS